MATTMDKRITPAVVETMHEILQSDDGTPTKWNRIVATLKGANIAHERTVSL